MKVSVVGKNEKITKKEFRFATRFFASKLMKESILDDLYIDIINERMKDMCGYVCSIETDLRVRPRNFEIVIDSGMGRRRMLRTLAHEMIHVKQYATGELRYHSNHEIARWKGVRMRNDFEYLEKPWEVEAYAREDVLLDAYIQHKKQSAVSF